MAKQHFKTAEKLLDMLLIFEDESSEKTADEISEISNTPKSTTYRYIRMLRDKGFLERSPSGGYSLGARLLKLGRIARGGFDLGKIALPTMENIARESLETVLLTRLSGDKSVCIERIEGPQTVRISFEVGHVQFLHAGASSKILLAYVNQDKWENHLRLPLEGLTENTITDLQVLRDQLDCIRDQGYCISDGEVDIGVRAVAVPIFGSKNNVVAALSI
ncbi:MAG: IclR family transcriptional regulator, partial [Desulfuromonadales bacterium]|nr:IclR family transcriptional regulator [Desulfuromonadales bacterium]